MANADLDTLPADSRARRLRRLQSSLRAIEDRGFSERRRREGAGLPAAVRTGWQAVDNGPLGGEGLRRGVLHEWAGVVPRGGGPGNGSPESSWTPPVALLVHLARRALWGAGAGPRGFVLWIGRAVWPYPHILAGGPSPLIERSLFVDPPDRARATWATDLALRSVAVNAVVADGRGLRIEDTRRLQLAAEAGGALALVARPPEESGELSVASTRWRVARVPNTESERPRWELTITRCKSGTVPNGGAWLLEWELPGMCVVVEKGGQGAGMSCVGRAAQAALAAAIPYREATSRAPNTPMPGSSEWNGEKSLVPALPPLVHRSGAAAPAPPERPPAAGTA